MKRVLIFTLVIGLFAVQADAVVYELDTATAAGMINWSVISGGTDTGSLDYVGYNPGTAVTDKISGSLTQYGDTMTYAVGFRGQLDDGDNSGSAIGYIYNSSPGLTGTYDSVALAISNDNNQGWSYQLFVEDTGSTPWSATSLGWKPLANKTQDTLTAYIGSDKDFSEVTGIGFRIKWERPGDSSSDDFHTSAVPEPATLALLGLGALGLLRRKRRA